MNDFTVLSCTTGLRYREVRERCGNALSRRLEPGQTFVIESAKCAYCGANDWIPYITEAPVADDDGGYGWEVWYFCYCCGRGMGYRKDGI